MQNQMAVRREPFGDSYSGSTHSKNNCDISITYSVTTTVAKGQYWKKNRNQTNRSTGVHRYYQEASPSRRRRRRRHTEQTAIGLVW